MKISSQRDVRMEASLCLPSHKVVFLQLRLCGLRFVFCVMSPPCDSGVESQDDPLENSITQPNILKPPSS